MLKDGDCLFSAVAFQLKKRYSIESRDLPLNQHLHLLGIDADKTDIQTPSIEMNMPHISIWHTMNISRTWLISSLTEEFFTVNLATPPLLL